MNTTLHPLALAYLRTVERRLAPLSRGRREEVLADLREHLDASLAGAQGDADVLNALDRLGDPGEVARAALAEAGVPAEATRPVMEWWALFLLSLGSLMLPVLGWIAGVTMVWSSQIWQRRHKVAATLMFPLGFFGPIAMWNILNGGGEKCVTTSPGEVVCTELWATNPALVTLFVFAVLSPFVSNLLLLWTLVRHREATEL